MPEELLPRILDAQHLAEHPSPGRLRARAWAGLIHAAERLEAGSGTERRALEGELRDHLQALDTLERYWAAPGKSTVGLLAELLAAGDPRALARTAFASMGTRGGADRHRDLEPGAADPHRREGGPGPPGRRTFTVLVVDDLSPDAERELILTMRNIRLPDDDFRYELVVLPSFQDAVFAATFNHDVQACVIRDGFRLRAGFALPALRPFIEHLGRVQPDSDEPRARAHALGALLRQLRPEVDLYLVTAVPVDELEPAASRMFRRVFDRHDHPLELHLSIMEGLRHRYDTPFFAALQRHSRRPTGVFHALPISRGNSVFNSAWIDDLGRFYGPALFLAETSATSGGLDSLLHPSGPLREAQCRASHAFASDETFFVTNGTSTANKIVVQALVRPGDIVLIDRSCHKSHHYALMLAGALPIYLDPYPLPHYSIYGAVPVRALKTALLQLRREGRLDRVRLVILTNCTFDGIVYNPRRLMEEALAIKPDLCFLWDEAWFAFAVSSPTYRQRTAMDASRALRRRRDDPDLLAAHRAQRARLADAGDSAWLEERLVPEPDRMRVRVYATQSTHKSLSALRQGSMIHVADEDFGLVTREAFMEAYMTHTSTSPNYQILASLDVARRQVELEGYALVQSSIEKAMTVRRVTREDAGLAKYFRVLGVPDLIPEAYCPSLRRRGPDQAFQIERAWEDDELVLDPTRITLFVGDSGVDGPTFRDEYLMKRLGVQVNKTSTNTVLLMTGIGTTWSAVAFLLDGLRRVADDLAREWRRSTAPERAMAELQRSRLATETPSLPGFSGFAGVFRPHAGTPEGDIRSAFYLAYDPSAREHLRLDGEVQAAIEAGREVVSAGFVTPYPPGFPILVPGQVVDEETAAFLGRLGDQEIHGYRQDLGLMVFREQALAAFGRRAQRESDAAGEAPLGRQRERPRSAGES